MQANLYLHTPEAHGWPFNNQITDGTIPTEAVRIS